MGQKGALDTGHLLQAVLNSLQLWAASFSTINGELMSAVVPSPFKPQLAPVAGATPRIIRLVSTPEGPPSGTALPQLHAGTARVLSVAARLPAVSWQ